jgi:hypothetical protein
MTSSDYKTSATATPGTEGYRDGDAMFTVLRNVVSVPRGSLRSAPPTKYPHCIGGRDVGVWVRITPALVIPAPVKPSFIRPTQHGHCLGVAIFRRKGNTRQQKQIGLCKVVCDVHIPLGRGRTLKDRHSYVKRGFTGGGENLTAVRGVSIS